MASPPPISNTDSGYTATAYALAGNAAGKNAVAEQAKAGLEDGSLKLSSIVLSMQNLVFDQSDPEKHAGEAMNYLVAILKQLKKDVLKRNDISLLTNFLQKNVQNDPGSFKQSCQALQSLSSMTRFTSTSASDLVSMIYNDFGDNFSTQPVTARFETYKLLNQLLNSHRKVIKKMGTDFIRIIDSLAATERDPRNLMLVFTMIEIVLNEWDEGSITETSGELYETLQRYFPISFRPKPNDPVTITANDLILRLRACFAAYGGFAPSLFPNLIQRLDDPNRLNAKEDVLETMATCIERYEPGVAAQWSSKLWEALKYEIFNLSDDSKAPNAMRVLTVIANRLSLGHELATIEGSPLQTYIYLVTTECLTRIREEGQKSSKSASRVLARIASASPFAYHLVIRATLPALLSQFEKSDTIISDKQCALEVINQLLDFRVNVEEMPEGSLKSSFLEVERSSAAAEAIAKVGGANVGVSSGGLRSYRDRLTSAFVQVARNPIVGERQYRITAMQGLSKLLQMKLYLDEEDIRSHVQYFASVIANSSEGSDEAQKEAVKALEGCAVVHPDELVDAALPILFADLPRKIQATENSTACIFILHAASRIFARSEAFTTLIKKLEALLMEGDMEEDEDDLCHNLKHTQWILAGTLAAVLQREKQEDLSFELRYETDSCLQWLMRHLVDNFFMLSERRIALRPIWSKIPQNDLGAQVIQLLGEIVMVCVRTGNGKQVFKPDAPLLPQVFGIKDSEALRYDIWNFDIPTSDQLAALVVVSGVVAGLPRQYVLLDISELNTSGLASFLAYRVSERVGEGVANIPATMRSSLLNLVAVLVNKHSHLLPPKDPQAAVDLQRSLLNPIGESEMSEDTIKNVIQVYAAITQAANMAGNKHTIALLNGLLDRIGFQNPTGMRFAQAFGAILSPSDILTSENNAIVRGLYKQRLFSLCVPKILEMFGQTQDEVLKSRYLAALGGILKNVPGDMIMPYIDRLLPFLLQSIDSGSESVKAVSIDVLRIASIESPDAVESHVSGIVKRLLACLEELLEGGYRCKPATRCKALVALGVLPKSLRMSVVLPCKKEVLGKLRESGEDKSRSVREKVVDCQMVWWKLAGVEEED